MHYKKLDQALLGKRIRECRKRKHLTQAQLAEMLNISPKFICEIERGSKGIALKNFVLLVQALEVSADYLLLGHHENTKNNDSSTRSPLDT